ncbi:MAG: transporter substrate-binding domain-containing protein [Magnetococcus sp. YQC-5]
MPLFSIHTPPMHHLLWPSALLMFFTFSEVSAGPVDCGSRPISLALFHHGFGYYEQDGQRQGIFPDLTDELALRSGCPFLPQLVSVARMWADIATGDIDMIIVGRRTPERDQVAWFIPQAITKDYALVHASAAHTVHSAADFLEQKRLLFGAVRQVAKSPAQDRWLEQLRREGRVEESVNTDLLFEKLRNGHVAAIFLDPPTFRKLMRDLPVDGQVVLQDWFPDAPGFLANLVLAKSRFSETEALRWRVIIREMHRDGTLERIYSRYLSLEEAKRIVDFKDIDGPLNPPDL